MMPTLERETILDIAAALGPDVIAALKAHGHTPLTIYACVISAVAAERVRRAVRQKPTPERFRDLDADQFRL
jgi:hypothetical protein